MDPPGDYQCSVIVLHTHLASLARHILRPALGPGSLLGSWRACSQAADAPSARTQGVHDPKHIITFPHYSRAAECHAHRPRHANHHVRQPTGRLSTAWQCTAFHRGRPGALPHQQKPQVQSGHRPPSQYSTFCLCPTSASPQTCRPAAAMKKTCPRSSAQNAGAGEFGRGRAQSRDLARRCSVVKPPQSVCTM